MQVVRPLAERLRKDGVKVWFDEWALKPGDSIPAKIEEGLECSRVLVLCISANAFGSDLAQLEASTLRFRDPLNKDRRVLPLRLGGISIYGQERNATTRLLAVMHLAQRGIKADFGPEHADTFRRDLHPGLRADYGFSHAGHSTKWKRSCIRLLANGNIGR
jgi:hypothetical protein